MVLVRLLIIVKFYKETNVSIDKGEIVSILGASGSGKITLLNSILGLEQPTNDQLLYDGEDTKKQVMEKRPFNIVFRDYDLFPNLSVYENLVYGLRKQKLSLLKKNYKS